MTRFNLAALQEQGMTPKEIEAFIRDKERSMYGGSQTYTTSTAGPRPPEPSYAPKPTPTGPVKVISPSITGPRPPEPEYAPKPTPTGPVESYTTFTAGPRPPEPEYSPKPTPSKPVESYTTSSAGPRPPEPKRTTTTTTKSTDFQVLLDKNRKKDTPAMVQEEEPATLASFQALLRKLQGG